MDKLRLNHIQDILDTMVEEGFVAGANCLVYQHGEEQGYYQAGFADVEGAVCMGRDTICHLYSMSKPVTAAAVMLLVEEGRLDLLDPVEKFLPSFAGQKVAEGGNLVPARRGIVIKDLLNMQSGLLYPGTACTAEYEAAKLFEEVCGRMGTDREMTTLEVADRIGRLPLGFQPGTKWQYGTSADVLGAVVEVVCGMRFGEFLERRFFTPLGMKDTGFYVPQEKRPRMAKVYEDAGKGLREYRGSHLAVDVTFSGNRRPAFESGGAGLVSTVEDYMKFGQMLLHKGEYGGRRILGARTVEFLRSGRLPEAITPDILGWSGMEGFQYGNLMRVAVEPGLAMFNVTKGTYGWDGWLGPYFANDPENGVTFLYMQQKTDTGATPYTRKLLNVLASALE